MLWYPCSVARGEGLHPNDLLSVLDSPHSMVSDQVDEIDGHLCYVVGERVTGPNPNVEELSRGLRPFWSLPGVLDLPSRHPDRPSAVERSGSAAFYLSPEIYGHGPQLANSCSRSGNPIAPLPSRSHVVPAPGGPPQAPNNAHRSGTSTAPLWGAA